ncbi:hypothetical protein E2C01_079101 [Portunus trituberculatus]|uniref:Uncharacterized protein n=1 Tax=Portunus trituberculatus TaxID=210409 RepID=A0A5B7IPQ9_PORTR|nr:hypothetical protein [Portunus trituberculatus]
MKDETSQSSFPRRLASSGPRVPPCNQTQALLHFFPSFDSSFSLVEWLRRGGDEGCVRYRAIKMRDRQQEDGGGRGRLTGLA